MPHPVPVRFVVQVHDAVDLFLFHQIGNADDQRRFVHLIRDLGDDDGILARARALHRHLCAHDHLAPAREIGVPDPLAAEDQATRGEIRSANDLHDLLGGGIRGIDKERDRRANLTQILRWDVGGHPDGDAARAVGEEHGKSGGEYERLFLASRRR